MNPSSIRLPQELHLQRFDPLSFEAFYPAAPKILQLDVDSTVIEEEVIDLLAFAAGRQTQVHALTAAAMHGDIDFKQSLLERVRLLAGITASTLEETSRRLTLRPGAEAVVSSYKHAGHYVGLCSGGFIQILAPLAVRLGVDYVNANVLDMNGGVLTGGITGEIVTAEVKAKTLAAKAHEYDVDVKNTIAVGDGANDVGMLELAGIGVAYHAKPVLRKHADIILEGEDMSALKALDYRCARLR